MMKLLKALPIITVYIANFIQNEAKLLDQNIKKNDFET